MNDIENFAKGQIETQDGVQERVNPVINKIKKAQESEANDPASEADWEYTDTVTLVAQSASKMYDGEPLTRTGDVLVSGLPAEYSITVSASGSQTEAGTGDNVVDTYTIKDKKGKDVTKHFKNIECVKGELVVEKAPLTIWTSSAVKTYDGTPLVSPDAKLTFSAGYETGQVPWRNTSYVATQKSSASAAAAGDEQILYGVCGITKVHGTNPITGETKNIDIKAGEKLTVILNDKQDEKSIEFKVEAAKISEIPEEIIRMYADNVQLLNTAAVDAGWTEEQIKELNARIQKLTEKDASLSETERTKTTEWNGLEIDQDQVDRMQLDLTDVRLTIDTDITNYNNRALGKEETHYTPVKVNNRIKLTAVGSQTDAGTSPNLYKIDWDGLKGNYEVTEKIGTLTVTQAPVTVTTGSGRKEYDGTPLTNPEASISGLVNGETASVTATGSITEAGTETNTYIIDWGGTNVFNYIVSEDLGTLEVAKNGSVITVSVSVTSKTYDGTPLTGDSVWVDGLPSGIKPASVSVQSAEEVTVSADSDDSGGDFSGYTYKVSVSGSVTDVGSAKCTIDSFQIFDPDGKDVTSQFFNITTEDCILTVTPAQLTVTTGSASKEYDGTALTSTEASITGLAAADQSQVTVTGTGTITDVGTAENAYSIVWGTASEDNYTLTEKLGTLKVAENTTAITFKAASAEKVYDGTALSDDSVTVTGLPSGLLYTADVSGSRTDAGSSDNTVDSYKILNADEEDVTSNFSNITTEKGILTVTKAAATVTTDSASKEYDGTALTSTGASITGLAAADQSQVTVTGTGTITDVGTAENAYSIVWGTASEDNYTLTENLGTLEVTVNTAAITFKAASAEKVYDGTALSDDSVTVTGLPSGLLYTADVSGSRTDAGSSDNTVDSYKILNAEEEDVTSNFSNITTEKGTLTVTKAAATVTTDSASKEYDGTALTSTGASITGLTTADQSQVTVTGTGTITDVGTAENAYSIVWGTASEDNYTLTENLGTLEVTANTAAITFKAASAEKVYDGTALSDDSVTVTGLPSGLLYTADVSGSRTDAGSSDNTVDSYKILNAEEEDVTSNFSNITTEKGTLTVTKAAATVTTDSASKEYDGTALTSTGASITGLTTADQSQVTVTGSGSITDVGTAQNTYDISWGSASGDNYTLTESLGTLEVTKNSTAITFKADSAEKEYDDTALTKDSVTVTGLPSGLLYTADVSGSQTAVGSSDNTVASYKILNADEEDVTSNFTSITTEKGTLTVTKNSTEITFTSASAEKVYDGTPLHANEVTVEGLPSGFTYEAGASGVFGIGSDVGSYENKFDDYSYSGVDEDGNPIAGWRYYIIKNADGEDVSDNFTNVSMVTGTITITPAAATVITPSDSKTYDGTALTCTDGAAITGLVDGETATVTADGTITDVGTTDNTYSITWGTAKETNYTLTENLGTLEVKALDVTFKVNTYTTTYDSFVHLPEGVSCTCNGTQLDPSTEYYADDSTLYMMVFDLPGGQIRLNGTCFTDADTYDATPYYAFESGTESNYNITFTNTEMIIEKATAIVTTGSATGPSGTAYPVTSEEAYISFLAHNDSGKVTVTATGKCTSVGSTVNTYEIDWGEVKSSNYTIVENLGTLTMFNAVIPVSEESTGSAVSTPASGNAAPKKEQENQTSETNETADSSTSDQEKAAAGDSESENSEDKAASDAENAETAETEPEETKEKSETEAVKESEEKSEEKAVEESEKESEEKQAAETEKKSEEKAAEETKEKSEEKTAVETEKKTEDKAAEVSEKKTEEKAAEVSEKKSEEKNEVKSEAKKEEKTSEKSVEKAEATVPEKTEEKSEEETGKKPEDEAAKEEETEE